MPEGQGHVAARENGPVSIGEVPWTRAEMVAELEDFARLYERRPIRDNRGGMTTPHLFMTWFALRRLKPKAIVESGLWQGQGTWLFEQACPDAELYCLDPDMSRLKYRSPRATYSTADFATHDWRHLPREDTVFFFDDHQNAYERLKTLKWMGFRQHIFFEDNYPPLRGDCYSLKKAFMHAGFGHAELTLGRPPSLGQRVRQAALRALGVPTLDRVTPNATDATYLHQNLATYYEFPPIYKHARTRWGDAWEDTNYPTADPLLSEVETAAQRVYWEEAGAYTWLCYVRLG
ncbi:hypothetical protein [Ferruginivarius sediminum]|uniref:Class I SAM-dependent methyltransferase n=1 Tax=Ferruginivarius sediminum TaxID=2661937 RepID=A0A369T993_9PROT|nr:hypothetical protein [Ferruginivarius sediminum]RDD61883.1 hypothetical protein DRB17_10350 [Ferruginivarius sediminum]